MKWLRFRCLMMAAILMMSAMVFSTALSEEAAGGCTVRVNGAEAAVYETTVCLYRTWTSYPPTAATPVCIAAAEGEAEIEAEFPVPVREAVVQPLSLGIKPEIEGNTVRFSASAPGQITVEINGGIEGALHLFLNAPVAEKPDPEDPNVIYFGPGEHTQRDIAPESGQTVYLDEGCVLYGNIIAQGKENITLAGPGVLSGKPFDRFRDTVIPVNFENCRNITVRDITVMEPAAWMLQLYACKGVQVENVKLIGACSNSDGITVQSCRDVQVRNCFVRSWDDSLVVKGYDADAADIHFENIQIWTDLAQSMEIGYETRAEAIEDISFRNITVLHNFHKPVISIHASDNAAVRNILYENITVEDAEMGLGDGQPFLIDLTTTKSQWSKTKERGTIRDVAIRNVEVLAGTDFSLRIFSFNRDYNVDDVSIENLTIYGQRITSFDQLKMNISPKNGANITIQ